MGERMPVGVPVPGVVQAADAPAGQGLAGRKGEVALATQPRPGSGGAAGCPKRRHLGYVGDEPEPGGAGPPPGTAPPGSAQGVSQGRMRLPSLSSAICSHARARSERSSSGGGQITAMEELRQLLDFLPRDESLKLMPLATKQVMAARLRGFKQLVTLAPVDAQGIEALLTKLV